MEGGGDEVVGVVVVVPLDADWSRMRRSATVAARSAVADTATSASHSDGRRKPSSHEQYCAPIITTGSIAQFTCLRPGFSEMLSRGKPTAACTSITLCSALLTL